jgi:hypothetical protein
VSERRSETRCRETRANVTTYKKANYFDCELDALEHVQSLLSETAELAPTECALIVERDDYQLRIALVGFYQGEVARFVLSLESKSEQYDEHERELGSFEHAEDCALFYRAVEREERRRALTRK